MVEHERHHGAGTTARIALSWRLAPVASLFPSRIWSPRRSIPLLKDRRAINVASAMSLLPQCRRPARPPSPCCTRPPPPAQIHELGSPSFFSLPDSVEADSILP